MKTVRHYATARDKLLHIETEGAVVNIRVGLTDREGRNVTSVEIIPDDEKRGGDGNGRIWTLDGYHNSRLIDVTDKEDPTKDDGIPDRPRTDCGCGFELVWIEGEWQHDAAPAMWGDDHDARAPEPTGPAREYWDDEDCVTVLGVSTAQPSVGGDQT